MRSLPSGWDWGTCSNRPRVRIPPPRPCGSFVKKTRLIVHLHIIYKGVKLKLNYSWSSLSEQPQWRTTHPSFFPPHHLHITKHKLYYLKTKHNNEKPNFEFFCGPYISHTTFSLKYTTFHKIFHILNKIIISSNLTLIYYWKLKQNI